MNTTVIDRKKLALIRSAAITTRLGLVILAGAAVGWLVAPVASASDSAIVTIGQLEAEGFDVNVDRIGSAPLSECTVTSVRNPQEQTRTIRVRGRRDHDRFIEVVVNRTITVSLDCSNR